MSMYVLKHLQSIVSDFQLLIYLFFVYFLHFFVICLQNFTSYFHCIIMLVMKTKKMKKKMIMMMMMMLIDFSSILEY
jgi:hypothetical protein